MAFRKLILNLFLAFSTFTAVHAVDSEQPVSVQLPDLFLADSDLEVKISAPKNIYLNAIRLDGKAIPVDRFSGDTLLVIHSDQIQNVSTLEVWFSDERESKHDVFLVSRELSPMPGWLSILPPLIAILLAILLKEVVVSLFAGLLSGVLLYAYYGQSELGLAGAFFESMHRHILPALNDSGHLSVIVFSLLIGGMVAIISKNGGMSGLVRIISRWAKTAKGGQLSTWFMGIAIFFDDYANTLVVGNTMRPVTDRLGISREKLAYIVDSTAAPIASIAFVTTWIGAQLDYIDQGVDQFAGLNESAYSIFLNSLSYSFYPVFTLFFMLLLILRNRDFGPMLKVERAARKGQASFAEHEESDETKALEPEAGTPLRAINAIIPVSLLIISTFIGLLYTGWNEAVWADDSMSVFRKLADTLGRSDSYQALLWSSLLAVASAIFITVIQRIMKLQQAMDSMVKGFGFMLPAIIILILAWALSGITQQLHTADFFTSMLAAMNTNPYVIPAITFVTAAVVSFSTGSSWSTMAILYPIILPSTWLLCQSAGIPGEDALAIFYNVVSCVLSGSVLGDHCSPISDTTILSSLASSCNHLSHVRTQMWYALTVGAVSVLLGTLGIAYGLPTIASFALGFVAIYLIIHILGRPVTD